MSAGRREEKERQRKEPLGIWKNAFLVTGDLNDMKPWAEHTAAFWQLH